MHIKKIDQICNNDAALTIMNSELTPNDMLGPKADIILACQKSNCQINLRWEKGHQDKGKKSDGISEAAQLNVDLDHLTEETRLRQPTVPV